MKTSNLGRICRIVVGALLLALIPSSQVFAIFDPVYGSSLGGTTYGVEAGDFNEDGNMDMVVAVYSGDTIRVLLGDGAGGFTLLPEISVNDSPNPLVVADLNNDSHLDIAVSHYFSHDIAVLYGNGDGSFDAPITISVGNSPNDIIAGDFNSDGRQDLVVTNYNGNTISLLYQNAMGGFDRTDIDGAGQPAGIVGADLNNDGFLDLAALNYSGKTLSIYLGTGSGLGAPSDINITQSSPRSIAAGDFNEDGNLDLAVTAFSQVLVYIGNGDGTFASPQVYVVGAVIFNIAIGYVDDDAHLDIAVPSQGDSNFTLLVGNGSGAFTKRGTYGASRARELTIADFSGDGLGDVALTTGQGNSVVLYLTDLTPPPAPVITSPTEDSLAGANPSIVGTAEPGATVEIFIGETSQGSTTADGNGDWSRTIGPLSEGSFTLTATARDRAGNVGPSSAAIDIVIDATPPTVPTITSPTDGTSTNDATPTITGTTDAGVTVEILINGVSNGSTTSDGDSNWSYTVDALDDGDYTITAVALDEYENSSDASAGITLNIDTVEPDPPTVDSPADGSSTNDTTPTISGTAEAHATVTVLFNGSVHGTTTASGTGSWSYTPGDPLDDGSYDITATATDGANNTGSASTSATLLIDATPPAAPVIAGPSDGAVTNDATPTVTGTAEAHSTVSVRVNSTPNGTTTADGSGNWSYTVGMLTEGSYTLTATATDAVNNTGPASNEVGITVDTTAPDAPVISSPADGVITNDTTPTIAGTGEANSVITIVIDGAVNGTTTANGSGSWSFTTGVLSEESHTITATATDAATNTGSASAGIMVTVDTTAPAAPAITAPLDGAVSNNTTPTISGTSEPDAIITIILGKDVNGTTTANGAGVWSYSMGALDEGSYSIAAYATDAGDNTGPTSDGVTITIDTTAPDAPVFLAPADGAHTNNPTPQITGTAEGGALVTVFIDGVAQGTAAADHAGEWQYISLELADGSYAVTTTAADAAANTSIASTAVALVVDTVAPEAPSITTEDGSRVHVPRPTISGNAEIDSVVTVFINGDSAGTTTTGEDGSWSFAPNTDLVAATYRLTAAATDQASNTSPISAEVTLIVSFDRDNDGIPDDEEERLGTDPDSADSDGDGISDAQELADGTNPLDRGSGLTTLPSVICAEWNGYFSVDGERLWNVMEHVNKSGSTLRLRTTLYDFEGNPRSEETFFLPPYSQHDLVVHDMEGHTENSYGQVCSELLVGNAGDLDGRMMHYKRSGSRPDVFEFVLNFPFSGGATGTQYVSFNNFHPSLDPADADNLAANWIQVVNKERSLKSGQLIFYGIDGAEIESQPLRLAPKTRLDISAHRLGREQIGLVEWRPSDPEARFTVRNVRYYYDNPGMGDSFDSAVELEAQLPSGELLAAPFNTLSASTVLELVNTRAEPVNVLTKVYDAAGNELSREIFVLAPHASMHRVIDDIVRGEGIVTVDSDTVESIIAVALEYERTETAGIRHAKAYVARQALGRTLTASYNSFLGQGCRLLVANPSATKQRATLSLTRYNGDQPLVGAKITIPAHGLTSYDLCAVEDRDVYGTATLQLNSVNTVTGWLVRTGAGHQVVVPLRQ